MSPRPVTRHQMASQVGEWLHSGLLSIHSRHSKPVHSRRQIIWPCENTWCMDRECSQWLREHVEYGFYQQSHRDHDTGSEKSCPAARAVSNGWRRWWCQCGQLDVRTWSWEHQGTLPGVPTMPVHASIRLVDGSQQLRDLEAHGKKGKV